MKSKFSGTGVFFIVFTFIFIIPTLILLIRAITTNGYLTGKGLAGILFVLFFTFLYFSLFYVIKAVRYIIIKDNKLTYYSLFRPWGKTLYFDNYIGKIIVQERGSGGAYNVVYLIDKNNRTVFKITGLHYRNFDDINRAIPLETINFTPNVKEYYKLLLFEKTTITEKNINKGKNKKLNRMLLATQIIVIIGLLLLIIRILLK